MSGKAAVSLPDTSDQSWETACALHTCTVRLRSKLLAGRAPSGVSATQAPPRVASSEAMKPTLSIADPAQPFTSPAPPQLRPTTRGAVKFWWYTSCY